MYTQIATKEKNAAEERMARVQAKLDEMQAQFDAAMAQKQVCLEQGSRNGVGLDICPATLHCQLYSSKHSIPCAFVAWTRMGNAKVTIPHPITSFGLITGARGGCGSDAEEDGQRHGAAARSGRWARADAACTLHILASFFET